METLEELIKIIKNNIDKDFVKINETPKRCVISIDYGIENVLGYLVTVHFTGSRSEEYIFISDVGNKYEFHHAPSLFVTDCFRDRCIWVSLDEVEIKECNSFYI